MILVVKYRLSQFKKAKLGLTGFAFLLFACLLLQSCDSFESEPVLLTGETMGTTYHVKYFVESESSLDVDNELIKTGIDELLLKINQEMSTYIENSDLSRLNNAPIETDVSIPYTLHDVLHGAQRISEKTGGAFDATVGELVNQWGFGPDDSTGQLPDNATVEKALNKVGYQKLLLSHNEDDFFAKKSSELFVDLSAIAKGYAVDKVAEYLLAAGINNYLVEIGGELRAAGVKLGAKEQESWVIAIEAPNTQERKAHNIIQLKNIAVATSGDYRNYFEKDGVRYSHTIDPRTGKPIDHKLASVTVLHDTCMYADAWATALMVLGPEEAMRIADENELAVYFIVKDRASFSSASSKLFDKKYPSIKVPSK